jgi:hypothetical protein
MKDKENIEQVPNNDVKESKNDIKSEVTTENKEEIPSLKEVIKTQAIEGEEPLSSNFTLRKILGGDILTTQTIRRQIGVFLLIHMGQIHSDPIPERITLLKILDFVGKLDNNFFRIDQTNT